MSETHKMTDNDLKPGQIDQMKKDFKKMLPDTRTSYRNLVNDKQLNSKQNMESLIAVLDSSEKCKSEKYDKLVSQLGSIYWTDSESYELLRSIHESIVHPDRIIVRQNRELKNKNKTHKQENEKHVETIKSL
jgi:hypothetical protein